MAEYLWTWSAFDQTKPRHEKLIEQYPNKPAARGMPYTGIKNLREESKKVPMKVEWDFDRPWDARSEY